jgi:Na+-transporting methylmalonyl-CoA/oxaloacetate decarboxylase gamma subunit
MNGYKKTNDEGIHLFLISIHVLNIFLLICIQLIYCMYKCIRTYSVLEYNYKEKYIQNMNGYKKTNDEGIHQIIDIINEVVK